MLWLPPSRRRALILAALMLPSLAPAEETGASAKDAGAGQQERLDNEIIFGFGEGADIGEQGEREIEITADGVIGKPGKFYALVNETAFRYLPLEGFRLAVGLLSDGHAISGAQNLSDTHSIDLTSGASAEFRWQLLYRSTSPLDLTVSFEPFWEHIDEMSGRNAYSYTLPLKILVDYPLAPEKTFLNMNVGYLPAFAHIAGGWQEQNPTEISLAAATAIGASFIGLEARQEALNLHGFYTTRALFFGPSLFVRFSPAIAMKVVGETQLPVQSGGRLDLVNFERFAARAIFSMNF